MHARIAVIATLLCLTLSACSDDADDGSEAKGTPKASSSLAASDDKAALKKAVRAYSHAHFTPDVAKAWSMLSARCRHKTRADAYRNTVEADAKKYGPQKIIRLDVEVAADMARVTYKYSPDPAMSDWRQPWTRVDGDWKRDAC